VVHARAEIGDQLELWSGLGDQVGAQAVGDGGDKHLRRRHRMGKGVGRHRPIGGVELGVEQFAHPNLDRIGKFTRHDDFRLAIGHVWA
jgi:hypothetical protein